METFSSSFSLCLARKYSVVCSSVTQPCQTLCNPMDCSRPGFPVLYYLMEFTQTHVPESVMPSNHRILCHPLLPLHPSFPESGCFPLSQLFTSGGQSIGASASASVLPMNIQDLFPLGLTALISLLSKVFSKVFSSTTIQRHQFFGTQPSLESVRSDSHICT